MNPRTSVVKGYSLAQRVFVGKVNASQIVVDDGSLGCVAFVSIRKIAPFDQRYTERVEITRAYAARIDDHLFAGFGLRAAFDAEIGTGKAQRQWKPCGCAGR